MRRNATIEPLPAPKSSARRAATAEDSECGSVQPPEVSDPVTFDPTLAAAIARTTVMRAIGLRNR